MVISYMTLFERKYKDKIGPDGQEYIHFTMYGGKRVHDLINDLLDYSRVDTKRDTVAPAELNDMLSKALNLLKVPIEESKAEIVVDPLPTIMADTSQMIQLMQNLVGNAIKFVETRNRRCTSPAMTREAGGSSPSKTTESALILG